MTLVAVSAAYGAGGNVIGPELAERLGVPFVDRAIPAAVAERLDVSVDDASAHDEVRSESFLDRLLRGFIGTDVGAPTPVPAEIFTSEDFRKATEDVILRQVATGKGVILGRGAVIVLRDEPGILRVRLDGPADRRARQAMELGGIDEQTARDALRRVDRTQSDYARQFYGVDIRDPALYHLVIDSTAIDRETCLELIVAAARALSRRG